MKTFNFELVGLTSLLMHRDDVVAADELSAWRKAPGNKGVSVAGDDRSPAWTWQTYMYFNNGKVMMPQENIMVALREAGKKITMKKMTTFKQATQNGLLIPSDFCEFLIDGKPIAKSAIDKLKDKTFTEQVAGAEALGFKLDVRRAKIGTSKHVRVRPKFDKWSVRGSIHVTVPEITNDVLLQLFELAGSCGLCDWRPSSPKSPGPYGQWREVKLTPA